MAVKSLCRTFNNLFRQLANSETQPIIPSLLLVAKQNMLDRPTHTAHILNHMSDSSVDKTNISDVLDKIAKSATKLCMSQDYAMLVRSTPFPFCCSQLLLIGFLSIG